MGSLFLFLWTVQCNFYNFLFIYIFIYFVNVIFTLKSKTSKTLALDNTTEASTGHCPETSTNPTHRREQCCGTVPFCLGSGSGSGSQFFSPRFRLRFQFRLRFRFRFRFLPLNVNYFYDKNTCRLPFFFVSSLASFMHVSAWDSASVPSE
jgi:hypothetical protein